MGKDLQLEFKEIDNSTYDYMSEWVDRINTKNEDTWTELEAFPGWLFKNLTFSIGIDPATDDLPLSDINVNFSYDCKKRK